MRLSRGPLLVLLLIFLITACSTENAPVYQLTTSSAPVEGGSVTPQQDEFDEGDEVEIRATSNEHWVFDRWQGDQTGSQNPVTLTMDSDKNISALFIKRDYPLSIEIEGEGTVSEQIIQSKSTDYPHGTTVELTAEPSEGWEFVEWNGDLTGGQSPAEITIDGETQITASFTRVDYELAININGQGEVAEEIIQSKATKYPFETEVQLTANPSEGWAFLNWEKDLSGSDNPISILIDQKKNVTANFVIKEFPITTSVEGNGEIELSPDQDVYPYGDTVQTTAIAGDGWEFNHWEGDLSGSQNPNSITIDTDKSVTAVFSEIIPELQLWQCSFIASCQSQDEWNKPDQRNLPYSSTLRASISTTNNSVSIARFFLRAIGESYTIKNVEATVPGNITSASFAGIENGTIINPGQDVEFELLSGKTGGVTTDIYYGFDIEGEDLSFTLIVELTTN